MGSVNIAQLQDLDKIVEVDKSVIGNDSRREYIKEAISQDRCLIVNVDGDIKGFLIYDTSFFGLSFVSFVMISPNARRKGYASALLSHFEKIAPTTKIFSSTNQSNDPMHQIFKINGFVKSGIIENLDEGDPEIIYFKKRN